MGLGGHSYEIAKRLGAPGHLIGFDKDPAALERSGAADFSSSEYAGDWRTIQNRTNLEWPTVSLMHGSFAEVGERLAPASLDGLLADLGMSSLQLRTRREDLVFRRKDRWT